MRALLHAVVALSPASLPFRDAVTLDAPVLLAALLAALLSGLVAGLLPALRSQRSAGSALRARTPGSGHRGRHAGGLTVTLQTAAATVLLIGAGLLARGFWTALQVDPGMRTGNTLTFSLTLPRGRDWTDVERFDLFDRIRERLVALPQVEDGALSLFTPLGGALPVGMSLEPGEDAPQVEPTAYLFPVSPGFLEMMGIPIEEGRSFQGRDDERGERVAIVDREAADRYWPGEDPVGEYFYREGEPYRVVGIAGVARQNGLLEREVPIVYLPFRQYPFLSGSISLRTPGDPTGIIPAVRQVITEEDPELIVDRMSTVSDEVWQALAEPRFYSVLVGAFGLMALFLAAAGLYAVVLLSVRHRRFEFGVRAALGARPADNLWVVLRQGVLTGGLGVVLGAAAGLPLTRVLRSVLYGVQPMDLLSAGVAAFLMLLAVLGATLTPAIDASRVDPVDAIRAE